MVHRSGGAGLEEEGGGEPQPLHLTPALMPHQQQPCAGDQLHEQGGEQANGAENLLLKRREGSPRGRGADLLSPPRLGHVVAPETDGFRFARCGGNLKAPGPGLPSHRHRGRGHPDPLQGPLIPDLPLFLAAQDLPPLPVQAEAIMESDGRQDDQTDQACRQQDPVKGGGPGVLTPVPPVPPPPSR